MAVTRKKVMMMMMILMGMIVPVSKSSRKPQRSCAVTVAHRYILRTANLNSGRVRSM
jgi:hypothetical protein